MTRKKSFEDNFWVTDPSDFTSSSGLDVLDKRLRDGRQICKDFEEFLKQRAKIEEEYARAMQKLARGTTGQLEIGTMKESWDTLRQQTEAVANEHSQMANTFQDRARELSIFAEQQKTRRKSQHESVKKLLQNKNQSHKRNTECKKTYEAKCREAALATEQLKVAKNSGVTNDKAQTKEQKALSDREKAKHAYKEANAILEQHRVIWEKDMRVLCETFEDLEAKRFDYLRNEVWIYANMMSQGCVTVDEISEKIRLSLERTRWDDDLTQFIDQKGTGQIRPAPIPYLCGEEDGNHSNTLQASPMSGRPLPPTKGGSRPPVAIPPGPHPR